MFPVIEMLLDAVIFDIGGTIVKENSPATSIKDLVPTLLPNVAADLEYLSRFVKIGAATNTTVMTEPDVRRLLDVVGIDRYFDVLVTSCDIGIAKPDPAPLIVAMERLELGDPARILYIGDRDIDEKAAHAASFQFAYVSDDGLVASVSQWMNQRL
jgi:FMN phosphatase YigB (HAD superfamily)